LTLASALRHPIERADVVELSAEVVEASAHFTRENRDALRDPRTRLIVGDGRTHLALGREQYDVLISEPSNPWIAGVAALFTREFFEAARARLAPGGVLCQWAHTYDMRDADLRSIVATFTSVFPESLLWLVGDGDVLLTGSVEPVVPRLEAIRATWTRPGVASDLTEVDVSDPDVLLSLLAANGVALARYGAGAALQRDDRLQLEFTAPRGMHGSSSEGTAAMLHAAAGDVALPAAGHQPKDAAVLASARGVMLMRAEANRGAVDEFMRALEHNPGDARAASGLIRAAALTDRLDQAERLLRRLLEADPQRLEIALALSRLRASRGDFTAGVEPLGVELARSRPDLRALEQAASVAADAGDPSKLADLVRALEQAAPDATATLYYSASFHAGMGRVHEALATAEPLNRRGDCDARCQNLLGALYAALGRRDEAQRAFAAAVTADPRDPTGYLNLGAFEMSAANPGAASRAFAEALTRDPTSAVAKRGLTEALAAAAARRVK
jgi:Flp pilus assembly protein TadD